MRVLWKIYFALWIALTLFAVYHSAGDMYLRPTGFVLEMFLWVVGTTGLFGYVFSARIGSERLWKYLAVAIIVVDVGSIVYDGMADWDALRELGYPILAAIYSIGALVLFPYYVALYLYGWRSKGIWHGQ